MTYAIIKPMTGLSGEEVWLSGAPSTPVSRTGNKLRLAPLLARAWGIRRGMLPSWAWRNDLDECCALLNVMYCDPALRMAVAERIRAMVPCPRCHAETRAIGAPGVPVDADGRVLLLSGRARAACYQPEALNGPPVVPGCEECNGTGTQDARRLWERLRKEPVPELWVERGAVWCYLQGVNAMNKAVVAAESGWTTHGFDGEDRVSPGGFERSALKRDFLADRLASHLYLQARSPQGKPVTESDGWNVPGFKPEWYGDSSGAPDGHGYDNPRWTLAGKVEIVRLPGGLVTCSPAECVVPDRLAAAAYQALLVCRRWVLYLDPPYLGRGGDTLETETTGYAHRFTRAGLCRLIGQWQRAARDTRRELTVAISESCGLAREMRASLGGYWEEHHLDPLLSRGSTFWAEDGDGGEWLTLSEPARGAMTKARQIGMFA